MVGYRHFFRKEAVLRKVGSVYDILMKYSGLSDCLTALVQCEALCV